jgi:hypothetical protein
MGRCFSSFFFGLKSFLNCIILLFIYITFLFFTFLSCCAPSHKLLASLRDIKSVVSGDALDLGCASVKQRLGNALYHKLEVGGASSKLRNIVKALLLIGGNLSQSREYRDLFEDVLTKVRLCLCLCVCVCLLCPVCFSVLCFLCAVCCLLLFIPLSGVPGAASITVNQHNLI